MGRNPVSREPGKRIGTLRVRLDRDVGRGNMGHRQRASLAVPLRLDSQGVFHAVHDGKWYEATTQRELHDKVKAAVATAVELVWRRYIVVKYTAESSEIDDTGFRSDRSGERFDLEDDRAKLSGERISHGRVSGAGVITGIDLDWEIVEYSDAFAPPEDRTRSVRSKRDVYTLNVSEDGKKPRLEERVHSPTEQGDDALPVGCMLWTPAREAFLRQIRDAIGKLDARMVALFNGVGDELAARVDAALEYRGDRLLGPGGAE